MAGSSAAVVPYGEAGHRQAAEFVNEIATLTRFFTLSLGKISSDDQERFFVETALRQYQHFFERTFAQTRHQGCHFLY